MQKDNQPSFPTTDGFQFFSRAPSEARLSEAMPSWIVPVLNRNTVRSRLKLLVRQFGISPAELRSMGFRDTQVLRLDGALIASSVAINILGLALPLAILQVYDRVIPQRSTETLEALLACLSVVVICDTTLRIARGYLTAWSAARFSLASISTAYDRTISESAHVFLSDSAATHQQRIQSVQRVCDFFGGRSRLILLDLPFIFVFVSIMGLVGGPLVFVLLAILAIFAVVTVQMGGRLKAALAARDQQDSKIYDFVSDCLAGVTTVKGMGMAPQMLRRFENLQSDAASIDFGTIDATIRAEAIVMALGNVTLVAMVSFGALLAVLGDMSIGTLSTCTLLSGRVIQPILAAASLWRDVQRIRLSLDRVSQLLSSETRFFGTAEKEAGPVAVDFRSVKATAHSVGDTSTIDLRIAAGEFVAFTGKDASWPSSILALVANNASPLSGIVHVAGVPTDEFRRRRPGAVVFVERLPIFFKGTILENLTLFGQGASVEQACGAAALIGIDCDINRLLLGYDTRLGDGIAETLPSGLLKRLSIARAIAMRPSVLLLDEPQAFLDDNSDKLLIAGLRKLTGHTTVLLATSRPSYLLLANRIFDCDLNGPRLRAPVAANRASSEDLKATKTVSERPHANAISKQEQVA